MGLSDDQITELLEWFVNSSEVNKEWSNRRKQGQEQAHEWLQPEILKDLSDAELSDKFRDYYKRGSGDKQHLIQLNRERVIGDIKKFRKTISYILDESIDIAERINQVLRGDHKIEGLGSAIATAILMDFKPEKYSLWNKKVEQGFSVLGWKVLQRGVSSGENYLNVISALKRLKNLYQDQKLSFLDVDLFLHTIAAEEEGKEIIKNFSRTIDDPTYLILTYKQGSPWDDELGVSYHYGSTVPNYKKVKTDSKFFLYEKGKGFIAHGEIGKIESEPPKEDNFLKYQAYFKTFDKIDPPIEFDNFIRQKLSTLDGYNAQHSIKVINKEIFNMILDSDYEDINYWQIAPGKKARLWSEFLEQSISAVGFSNINIDLKAKPKNELFKLFRERYPEFGGKQAKIKFNQLWNFINLKPGDKIITNQGKSKLLGLGKVVSGYNFQPDRLEYKHTIEVKYYKTAEKEIKLPDNFKGKFGRTILQLTKDEFESLEKLFNGGKMDLESIRYPLNQIFCGPPGTGKTYQTINYAIAIIENKNLNEINNEEIVKGRNVILERFNHYKSEGQIEFITFHQNYAYEDFIQGLRPGLESGGKSLVFELRDGVFKKIADTALNNYKASRKGAQTGSQKPPFVKAFKSFFQKFFEGEQETVEIPMKRVSYKITDISEKSIFFVKHSGGTGHTLSINTLSEYYDQEKVTMEAGLRIYYKPLLRKLIEHSKTISSDESRENLKNHVIIIDEINRANISRVFGELITLIESDKRYGQTNELKTTLPSRETFSVPPNLFIIGTMNTADKSIALLDIALRRRFEFIKIYPDSNLVISDFRELFDKMNQQIIKRKGPDFQIGHAYFMENAHQRFQIKDVMDKKVIPLLYEYFMNDGEAVNEILASAGVSTIQNSGLYEFESLQNK